jgi:hypothetical protein
MQGWAGREHKCDLLKWGFLGAKWIWLQEMGFLVVRMGVLGGTVGFRAKNSGRNLQKLTEIGAFLSSFDRKLTGIERF